MEKIEYLQLPSINADLKFIVFRGNQEYHVVIEEGSKTTLKEILMQKLHWKNFELVPRGQK